MERKKRAKQIAAILEKTYPGTARELCSLDFKNGFQLLVATILSAQCTDERVNMVTPQLFKKYPNPKSLADAPLEDVERLIKSTGFYHSKALNLKSLAECLVKNYNSKIPSTIEELTSLPGVGRKTANVYLSVWLNTPGFPVDTHVKRVANRLGLTQNLNPEKIESDLCELFPPSDWGAMSIRMILLGREYCKAKNPLCQSCPIDALCPKNIV